VAQRLTEADVTLGWNIAFERDILLGVVQWSALTRILREAHALFAATLFDTPIERGRALKLFDDALRQKSVLRREQALATPCEAKPGGAAA